jgi:hypothetical protein
MQSVVLEKICRVNQPQPKSLPALDLQVSQSKLLNKLNSLAQDVGTSMWLAGEPAGAAEQADKVPPSQPPKFFDDRVELLAPFCRMVTDRENATFAATLEMIVSGNWIRIACYEHRHGHGYRYSYYSDGKVKPFRMDLPLHVVLEMAREDFHRNWLAYCQEFSTQNGVARA